jgi:outer membrane immunogenic protein
LTLEIEGLNMKKLALALAATAAFGGQAIAADMPMKAARPAPVVAPVASWTGCYIGGGVGYGLWQQENVTYFNAPPAAPVQLTQQYDTGGRGWLGRAQVGCDYQFGLGTWNVVIGAFGDYDWADLNGRFADPFTAATGTETLNSQWAVGGRIGVLVTPQLLTYFTGGYTEAKFDYGTLTNVFTINPPIATGTYLPDHTYKGWFLGSGLEYALGWVPGLYLKTEYRFSEFDTGTNAYRVVATNALTGFEVDSTKYVHTVTTSLSYKFNFGGPVIAKY